MVLYSLVDMLQQTTALSFFDIEKVHQLSQSPEQLSRLKTLDIVSLKSEYFMPGGLLSYGSGENCCHFLIQRITSFVIMKCLLLCRLSNISILE